MDAAMLSGQLEDKFVGDEALMDATMLSGQRPLSC
jgi:hypothetical protein